MSRESELDSDNFRLGAWELDMMIVLSVENLQTIYSSMSSPQAIAN